MTLYTTLQKITSGNLWLVLTIIIGIIVIVAAWIFSKRYFKAVAEEEKIKKVSTTTLKSSKLKGKSSPPEYPDKPYIEIDDYDPLRTGKSRTSWRFWKTIFLERKHPDKVMLINMELQNGFHLQFLVKEKEGGFSYRGKKYIFDNELKYFNISAKNYAFDYHENFTMPIKRKIPVAKIKQTLEQPGISEIEYMTNPSTLERFIVSRIAEGIMKGQQLDEFFKKINLYILVIMVAVLVHLVLFIWASGMLKDLKVPSF